jgi:D-glycero-alpha-D-manno-heptose-7-phosphate kinase
MLDNLHYVKDLGFQIKEALESCQPERYADLMHQHWMHKRERSTRMSNPKIDRWYDIARHNGALGGKLIGAGGGGFLLLYVKDRKRLQRAMSAEGLTEVLFQFDHDGSVVIARS